MKWLSPLRIWFGLGVAVALSSVAPVVRAQTVPQPANTPTAAADAADPVLAAMIEVATKAIGRRRANGLYGIRCYREGYCESSRVIDVDPVTLKIDERIDDEIYDAGDKPALASRYAKIAHHRWPADPLVQRAYVDGRMREADTLAAMRGAAASLGFVGLDRFAECSLEGYCTVSGSLMVDVDPITLKIDARDEITMIYDGDDVLVRARLEKIWRDKRPGDPVGQQQMVAVYLEVYEFKAMNQALGMKYGGVGAMGGAPVTPDRVPFVVELRYRADNADAKFLTQLNDGGFGKPWQARHACGGSLIAPQWVLTAAHCVKTYSIESASLAVQVRVGDISSTAGTQINIDGAVVHAGYRRFGEKDIYHDDIALLHLDRPATLVKGVKTIALAPAFAGDGLIVAAVGWGLNRDVSQKINATAVLTEVELTVIDNVRCAKVKGKEPGVDYGPAMVIDPAKVGHLVPRIQPKVICASGRFRKTCEGDSGGPLFYDHGIDRSNPAFSSDKPLLVGVVSWNKDGCNIQSDGEPGVYTRVQSYRDWITRAMAQKLRPRERRAME